MQIKRTIGQRECAYAKLSDIEIPKTKKACVVQAQAKEDKKYRCPGESSIESMG
jgi:hypothetical protein